MVQAHSKTAAADPPPSIGDCPPTIRHTRAERVLLEKQPAGTGWRGARNNSQQTIQMDSIGTIMV